MQESRACMTDLIAVIPCYNAGKRLGPVVARLQSSAVQTILVDDGGTDGAVDAVAQYIADGMPQG